MCAKLSDEQLRLELAELEGLRGRAAGRRRRHIRERLFVRERRARLVERLGGRCVCCGSTDDLEFDHYPALADWAGNIRRGMSQRQRMDLYERDADADKLRLLCATCNGGAGGILGLLSRGAQLCG